MRIPTVRYSINMTPAMRARISRFARELALPADSDLVLIAVAQYIDRLIMLRGEAFAEIPDELKTRKLQARAAGHPEVARHVDK